MRALPLTLLVLVAAGQAAADDRCLYDGKFYGPGGVRCQDGFQQQCVAGTWRPLGLECAAEGAGAAGLREAPGVPTIPNAAEPPVGMPQDAGDSPVGQPGAPTVPR